MKIAIARDHGGLDLKRTAVDYLHTHGYEVVDFGTNRGVFLRLSRFRASRGGSRCKRNVRSRRSDLRYGHRRFDCGE